MAASVEGTLAYVDCCVRLDNGLVPVFSEDAVTWDGTTLTWRNEDYVMGQKISLGGGEAPADRFGQLLPDACGDGPAWIVGGGRLRRLRPQAYFPTAVSPIPRDTRHVSCLATKPVSHRQGCETAAARRLPALHGAAATPWLFRIRRSCCWE
jgi:hypothetical protein